jgi:hypothetical protein
MQIYYPSLQAIEQRTMQLDSARCAHCGRSHQLVSHGFIRKKQVGARPQAVGKRVYCSNRRHHTGCGRTMQLYLDASVRYLHRSGGAVVAFVLALMAGVSIQAAYHSATGSATPRHAYRWLDRLNAQASAYRSVPHLPPLRETGVRADTNRPARLVALASTFTALLRALGQHPCAAFQLQLQRTFL